MRYFKIVNNTPIEYSIEQLLIDHPGAQICDIFLGTLSEKMLKSYNVYPLIECPKINIEEDEQNIEIIEGDPIFKDGRLIQTWVKKNK